MNNNYIILLLLLLLIRYPKLSFNKAHKSPEWSET